LQHYAVKESRLVECLGAKPNAAVERLAGAEPKDLCWQSCVIIPAYAEIFSDLASVARQALQKTSDVLQIWVINCPDEARAEHTNSTRQCLQQAMAATRELWSVENLSLRCFEGRHVLLVDRCSADREIPVKQGVGLARKIGGDIALVLYRLNRLNSAWCGFTDADAILPADYFQRLLAQKKGIAAVFPYLHNPEGGKLHQQVIKHYQVKLDHHVAGLRQAGSPYAFHTIGSTIAVNLNYYEQVRGIPARAAGEDFYLLNKLAKLGAIECLPGVPIVLSGRRSLRVPFGTGPAIDRSLKKDSKPLTVYNPVSYRLLKVLLASVDDVWQQAMVTQRAEHLNSSDAMVMRIENSLERLRHQFDAVLRQACVSCRKDLAGQCIGHFQLLQNMRGMLSQSTSQRIFRRHFHCWFDGFRTLKFIHWWRDHGLPDCPIYEQ